MNPVPVTAAVLLGIIGGINLQDVTVRKDHKGRKEKEPGARIQEPEGQG
jgi:hypothetical protein